MLNNTRNVLEQVAADWMGKDRDWETWEHMFDSCGRNMFGTTYAISWSTFRRYATLEKVETFVPVTVEELVDMLNDCAGNDLYGASWEYVMRDGLPYERVITYRLVNINFD